MIKQKTALFTFVLSFLVACGSSDSQGIYGTNDDAKPKPKPEPSKPTRVSGYISKDKGMDSVSGSDINSIHVAGQTIVIAQPGITSGGFTSIRDNNGVIITSGTKYQSSKFGMRTKGLFNVFSQGYASNGIPDKGTATYQGDAIGLFDDKLTVKGKSQFVVDFRGKIVKGKLFDWDKKGVINVPVLAKIKGSSFSSFNTLGRFYGENAKEMSGVSYYTENGHKLNSAFGAIKK